MTAPESEDRREAILTRIEAVAKTLVRPDCVFRNQLDIPPDMRPAIVIFDADEDTDERSFGLNRPPNSELLVEMVPEIYCLLEASASKVGPALNRWRIKILRALLRDTSLVALLHAKDIRYLGFATGLAVGRSMEGESGFRISFRYMLRPDKL